MKALYTDNDSDIKEMLQDGFKYAIRNTWSDSMCVVSRHRTYEAAKKAATDAQSIIDLAEVE